MAPKRWVNRPEGSTWGDFGPDDQLGRLNLITPERCCRGLPRSRGQALLPQPAARLPGERTAQPAPPPAGASPDLRTGVPNIATHDGAASRRCRRDQRRSRDPASAIFDAMGQPRPCRQLFDADGDGVPEQVFYNGFRAGARHRRPDASEGRASTGPRHSISSAPRAGHREHGRDLRPGPRRDDRSACAFRRAIAASVGYDRLMRIMEGDKVEVEKGDMVCFHTGFAEMLLDMKREPDPGRRCTMCAGARRPRPAAAATGSPRPGCRRPDRRQLRASRPCPRSASADDCCARCRCMSIACSSSACISARCGI